MAILDMSGDTLGRLLNAARGPGRLNKGYSSPYPAHDMHGSRTTSTACIRKWSKKSGPNEYNIIDFTKLPPAKGKGRSREPNLLKARSFSYKWPTWCSPGKQ